MKKKAYSVRLDENQANWLISTYGSLTAGITDLVGQAMGGSPKPSPVVAAIDLASKRAKKAKTRDATPEDADAAFDAAPEIPLTKEQIEDVVRFVTAPKKTRYVGALCLACQRDGPTPGCLFCENVRKLNRG